MVFFTFDEPPIYKKALKYITTCVKRCQISGIPLNLVTEKKLSNAHLKKNQLALLFVHFPLRTDVLDELLTEKKHCDH